ncbi:MAG: tRNA (guanosine(46)-N7)-methyltransferase TrmB [Saprospiraceae bacterium]
MSRRHKLQKFSELGAMTHVYQCFDPMNPAVHNTMGEKVELKGNWQRGHFHNSKELVLELACGRGEYTVAMAQSDASKNFVGVDVKGARIWKGATQAQERGLDNVAFLRTRIEVIESFFAEQEVSAIWITFPDPFLKDAKSNRRLTSPYFLEKYRQILKTGGLIYLKTDEGILYDFTLDTIKQDSRCELKYADDDIYSKELPLAELEIPTYYERQHLANGKTIKYICFDPGN